MTSERSVTAKTLLDALQYVCTILLIEQGHTIVPELLDLDRVCIRGVHVAASCLDSPFLQLFQVLFDEIYPLLPGRLVLFEINVAVVARFLASLQAVRADEEKGGTILLPMRLHFLRSLKLFLFFTRLLVHLVAKNFPSTGSTFAIFLFIDYSTVVFACFFRFRLASYHRIFIIVLFAAFVPNMALLVLLASDISLSTFGTCL